MDFCSTDIRSLVVTPLSSLRSKNKKSRHYVSFYQINITLKFRNQVWQRLIKIIPKTLKSNIEAAVFTRVAIALVRVCGQIGQICVRVLVRGS